jgi:hypothetical protein
MTVDYLRDVRNCHNRGSFPQLVRESAAKRIGDDHGLEKHETADVDYGVYGPQ